MTPLDLPKDRTYIEHISVPFSIDLQTPLLFIGSCFSENIGNQLQYFKFPVLINPMGTMYNPISISNTFKMITQNRKFSKDELSFSNGKYFHYLFNTRFSDTNPEVVIRKINSTIEHANIFFKKTKVVFITLGTSFAYQLNSSGTIVSNCHKQPVHLFTRILLDIETIAKNLETTIQMIGASKKIVLTVSPIRHLKDGLIQNQRSKSQLISVVHKIISAHKNTFYFPSYEIMMDELRDYRYYDESLTHLNSSALKNIFHYFANTFFDNTAISTILHDIDKLNKLLRHNTDFMNQSEQKEWQKKIITKISYLSKKYPFFDFTKERAQIK